MKNIKTILGLILLMAFLVHITGLVYAQSEIMPIGDIEIGMHGIGKTVISGTDIEEFDVEILGILHGQSQVGDLILVQVNGPLIDKAGGIAAGMSGSPVYIDGKLIGAIGYGWELTDHRMGLITPIESMLKVLEKDASYSSERIYLEFEHMKPGLSHKIQAQNFEGTEAVMCMLDDELLTQVYFTTSYEKALTFTPTKNTLVAYPVRTPLMVSGLSGRALDRLMEDLKEYDLVAIQTGGSIFSQTIQQPLEPGSAIAVQLVHGDIDVSSIGTLTYLEGDKFLAFGHPFLKLGAVEYCLSSAEILTVVDSLDMPFKLGVAGEPRGIVTQDRNAAIAGYLDKKPLIIPVSVTVHDLDLHEKQEIAFQVIRNEELMVSLVANAVLQAVDTVMDRQGYGTSTIKMKILGNNLPDQMLKYHNMYYSSNDIAAMSLGDLYSLLDIISSNPFEKVDISSIELELQILRNRQFAILEEIKLLNETLHPGDTAQVQVTFRPYRGELIQTVYEVKIPDNILPGEASLTVSGGAYSSYGSEESVSSNDSKGEMVAVGDHIKTLEALLNGYLKKPKNNELIIEIVPYSLDESSELTDEINDEGGESTSQKGPAKVNAELSEQVRNAEEVSNDSASTDSKQITEIFPTQYVLEGNLTLEITISDSVETSDDESNVDDSMGNVLKENN